MSSILNKTIRERSLLVATAGHVDHGKSTLIKSLTGTDPDRLPQEKSRGMTLDLGFASTHELSFIDCPGHDGLIRHMVAGTNAVDGICLVIAANEGICEQTREHANVLKWLKVKKVFLVISKTDLIDDPTELELICEEIFEQTKMLFGDEVSVLMSPFSNKESPQNLPYLMKQFFHNERTVTENSYDRFFIDRSFVIKGTGTVVTGTFFEGLCSLGGKYTVWFPSARKPRDVVLKAIRNGSDKFEEQNRVERAAFALDGVKAEEITRGSTLILTDQLPRLSDNLLLQLNWLIEPKKQQTLIIQLGTLSLEAQLRLHPTGIWRCHLEYPAPFRRLDKIIIRQPQRLKGIGHCVAGGIVLDAHAPLKKISQAPPTDDLAFLEWAKLNFHNRDLESREAWSEKTGWNLKKVFQNIKFSKPLSASSSKLSPAEPRPLDDKLLSKILEEKWEAFVAKDSLDASYHLAKQEFLFHIKDNHFLHRDHYRILINWLYQHFQNNESLSIAEARDFFQVGRKSFLQILEFCDRHQMTFRKDNVRKKFKLVPPWLQEVDPQ